MGREPGTLERLTRGSGAHIHGGPCDLEGSTLPASTIRLLEGTDDLRKSGKGGRAGVVQVPGCWIHDTRETRQDTRGLPGCLGQALGKLVPAGGPFEPVGLPTRAGEAGPGVGPDRVQGAKAGAGLVEVAPAEERLGKAEMVAGILRRNLEGPEEMSLGLVAGPDARRPSRGLQIQEAEGSVGSGVVEGLVEDACGLEGVAYPGDDLERTEALGAGELAEVEGEVVVGGGGGGVVGEGCLGGGDGELGDALALGVLGLDGGEFVGETAEVMDDSKVVGIGAGAGMVEAKPRGLEGLLAGKERPGVLGGARTKDGLGGEESCERDDRVAGGGPGEGGGTGPNRRFHLRCQDTGNIGLGP